MGTRARPNKDPNTKISSPKRKVTERQGLHAWHPYYAGFSSSFVLDVLGDLGLPENGVVLDPMNGSGTTTYVAQSAGILSLGCEMNPAIAKIARAKDAIFKDALDFPAAIDEVIDLARAAEGESYAPHPDALKWIPRGELDALKRLQFVIESLSSVGSKELAPTLAALSIPSDVGGSVSDFLYAALLITARKCSIAEGSKNPTWIKPGQPSETGKDVFGHFRHQASQMQSEINEAFTESPAYRITSIIEGDAGALPLPSGSIDAVVTSPPYLTRIDYAVGTAPELVVLGYEEERTLRDLRRSIMGSTCIAGGDYEENPSWGRECLSLLAKMGAGQWERVA